MLADREVAHVGEPVAVVLAESRYIAEDAAALVRSTMRRCRPSPIAAPRSARRAAARIARHRPISSPR